MGAAAASRPRDEEAQVKQQKQERDGGKEQTPEGQSDQTRNE